MTIPAAPPAGLTARALWLELHRLTGASLIGIQDTAGYFDGDTIEEALEELAAGIGVTDVSAAAATELTIAAGVVTATQTYHQIDTQGDAVSDDLDTINGLADGQFYVFEIVNVGRKVTFKHGTGNIKNPSGRDILLDVTNDKIFGFSDGTSFFVLDMALASAGNGGLANALGSLVNGQGAALVGVQDAGAYLVATTVEAALAEVAPADRVLRATITAAAAVGVNTSLMSVQLKRLDGVTSPATIRQFLLLVSPNSSRYMDTAGPPGTATLGTVTAGAVVATIVAGSLFLIQTDATGLFAATLTNAVDETLYLAAKTASGGVSVVGEFCTIAGSNSQGVTWSP